MVGGGGAAEHPGARGPQGVSAHPHSSSELRQVTLEVGEEGVTDSLSLSGTLAKACTPLDSLSPLSSHGALCSLLMGLSEVQTVAWRASCLVVTACWGQSK